MYVIDPPKQSSLAVQGTSDRFPVRRVFCVGRNYEAHVLETVSYTHLTLPTILLV